jgi:hypothetical protein
VATKNFKVFNKKALNERFFIIRDLCINNTSAFDVRSLFLQLARQSSPVVEIGAAKKISVIITELVILTIPNLCVFGLIRHN